MAFCEVCSQLDWKEKGRNSDGQSSRLQYGRYRMSELPDGSSKRDWTTVHHMTARLCLDNRNSIRRSPRRAIAFGLDLDLCKIWLGTCADHHARCDNMEQHYLPSRVIKINNSDHARIQLIQSCGMLGQYVTLSY
jgi:hypothetical protein